MTERLCTFFLAGMISIGCAGHELGPVTDSKNTGLKSQYGLQTYTAANHFLFANWQDAADLMQSAGASWVRIPIEWKFMQFQDQRDLLRNYSRDVLRRNQRAVFMFSTAWKTDQGSCRDETVSWPQVASCKQDYASRLALAASIISESLPKERFVIQVGNEVTNRLSLSDPMEWESPSRRQDYADLFPLIRAELARIGKSANISPAPHNNNLSINNTTSVGSWLSWLNHSGTLSHVNALSLHPYRGTATGTYPEDNLADLLATKNVAAGRLLLATELGYDSLSRPQSQPELNMRALLISWIGGADAAILYEAHDRKDFNIGHAGFSPVAGSEGQYGIYRVTFSGSGTLTRVVSTFTPKPAATYLSSFFDALGDFDIVSHSVSASGDHWTLELRHNDGRRATVKWAKKNPTTEFPERPAWSIVRE